MSKDPKEHWSRHPLLIAIVSTCLFALVVGGLGSFFQHRNWKKQEEISRKKTHQEKLFDNRTEIAKRLFYLIRKRETNAWSLYSACNFPTKMDFVKYWDIRQEIICEDSALRQQIAIYFGLYNNRELLRIVWQINEIWSQIEKQLCKHPDCKNITKDFMHQKSEEATELENKLIEIFKEILYNQQKS